MRINFNPLSTEIRRPFKQLGKTIENNQRETFGVAKGITASVAGAISDVAAVTTIVGLGVITLANPFNWRVRV